jgi:hypothetical protein
MALSDRSEQAGRAGEPSCEMPSSKNEPDEAGEGSDIGIKDSVYDSKIEGRVRAPRETFIALTVLSIAGDPKDRLASRWSKQEPDDCQLKERRIEIRKRFQLSFPSSLNNQRGA